jgi:hypothetical protein
MEALPSVNSIQEILDEAETLRAGLTRLKSPAAPRFRGEPTLTESLPTRAPANLANPVARRCDPISRRRLVEIDWWEANFPPTFDPAPLIVQCCQVIEQELTRIVAAPSKRLGPVLLRALEGPAKPQQKEIVAGWLEGRVPTTMGTVEIILFALRKGKEQGLSDVEQFLSTAFRPGYANLLTTNGPARALARIRQGFRNPAAHGEPEIPGSDYGEFCDLAVACSSFGAWGRMRAVLAPSPDRGLLHHHLSYLPGEFEPAAAGSALISLTTPPESRLSVSVKVEPTSPSRPGSPGTAPRGSTAGYRVGDTVRFVINVHKPCWIALLAQSANNGASVLLPNRFRPYRQQCVGTLHVPDPMKPECEFPLEGPPGTQSVCVLATSEPLPAAFLHPTKNDLMRSLNASEADELAAAFEALPDDGRAVGWCRFEVGKA